MCCARIRRHCLTPFDSRRLTGFRIGAKQDISGPASRANQNECFSLVDTGFPCEERYIGISGYVRHPEGRCLRGSEVNYFVIAYEARGIPATARHGRQGGCAAETHEGPPYDRGFSYRAFLVVLTGD
jgi:hypothetical protein